MLYTLSALETTHYTTTTKTKMQEKPCKNCKTYFLPSKKTSEFCSTKCSNSYNGKKRQAEQSTWNLKKEAMKICDECNQLLPRGQFSKLDKYGHPDSPRKSTCKKCSHKLKERERRARSWRDDAKQTMINNCRQRSKAKGMECTITKEDIDIPESCPVLGIPLKKGGNFLGNSPSVDRVDNTKGYIPGNVQVISYRANAIKSDATKEELALVLEYVNKYPK